MCNERINKITIVTYSTYTQYTDTHVYIEEGSAPASYYNNTLFFIQNGIHSFHITRILRDRIERKMYVPYDHKYYVKIVIIIKKKGKSNISLSVISPRSTQTIYFHLTAHHILKNQKQK